MIEEARWASKNSVDRVVRTTHISCVKICWLRVIKNPNLKTLEMFFLSYLAHLFKTWSTKTFSQIGHTKNNFKWLKIKTDKSNIAVNEDMMEKFQDPGPSWDPRDSWAK